MTCRVIGCHATLWVLCNHCGWGPHSSEGMSGGQSNTPPTPSHPMSATPMSAHRPATTGAPPGGVLAQAAGAPGFAQW